MAISLKLLEFTFSNVTKNYSFADIFQEILPRNISEMPEFR